MTHWDQQLQDHAIHNAIKEAQAMVSTKFDNTSADAEVEKRRMMKVLDLMEETMSALDGELAPFSILDSINNAVRQPNIWNHLTAFASTGEPQALVTANKHLTAQVAQIGILVALSKQSKPLRPLKNLEAMVDDFASALDERKKLISGSLEELSATSDSQRERLDELAGQVDAKRKEADALTSEWQKQFSQAQESRSTEFANWRKTTLEEFVSSTTALVKGTKRKSEELYEHYMDRLKSLHTDASMKHTEILALHGLVAGDSVAAGYLQSAVDEKTQANFWRWAAVLFILATAIWTGTAYFSAQAVNIATAGYWGQILKAFSVTGVLLFGAVYSARQSNLHRNNEARTRWLALEVKAIDPFIASLPDAEQFALKQKLSERIFGQGANHQPDEKVVNEHMLGVIMKEVGNLAKALKP